MIGKPIDSISWTDLEALIANGVSESRSIEYKRDLPDETSDSRKEFLADVSSFANADGGDLLFGIVAVDGIPQSISGIAVSNLDQSLLQWENLIREGLSPRIAVEMRFVSSDEVHVLIIRVKKSWNKPHRIEYKSTHRFYSRNSAGKYLLGIDELRGLFVGSEDLARRSRDFISLRNDAILHDDGFRKLGKKGKLAFYVIPSDAFTNERRIPIDGLESKMRPPFSRGWSSRINLEGFLNYFSGVDGTTYSYVQIYRNGIVEAATSGLFDGWKEEDRFIPSAALEKTLVESVSNYLGILKSLEVIPPLVLGVALTNISDYTLAVDRSRFPFAPLLTAGKDVLRLPEFTIQEYPDNTGALLRPVIDSFWNAFGFNGSPNFDPNGIWIEH
jgi:hypothetical protein